MFSRAASVSGSLWYPDFVSRMSAKAPCKTPERVYFSLGDGESKTRNKSLAAVDECTQAAFNIMRSLGVDTVFERNEGGHYNDPVGRTMRGLGWLFR